MRFKIFRYKNVTSTNDVAINLIREENEEKGYVLANKQTRGRGTYGKKWISSKGNLFSTIFFPLKKNYPPFNEFSIINPIIISSVIENFCDKEKITFKLPNDIYVNEKKICGILQELMTFNNKKFLLIGIGINICSNPNIKIKYKATNILLETGKKPSIKQLFELIVLAYNKFFINLKSYDFANFKKKLN